MEYNREFSKKAQIIIRIALGMFLVIFLAAAASIPVYFESQSLYYKFGTDKALLRLGKISGLFALVLMLLQIVLISRFGFMIKSFGLKTLFTFHRNCGKIILGLVLLHPLGILASDQFSFFPFERRYWPEFVGVGLFFIILAIVVIAIQPRKWGLSVKISRIIHQTGTLLIVLLAFFHAFFVSESFDLTIPKVGLSLSFLAVILLFLRLYYKKYFKSN